MLSAVIFLVFSSFFCGSPFHKNMEQTVTHTVQEHYQLQKIKNFPSKYLKRDVEIDIFLPPGYSENSGKYPFLLLNDGQDNEAVRLKSTLDSLTLLGRICNIIAVGVYAGHDRMHEYGVATQADYKQRGSRAAAHTDFILKELLPYLVNTYRIDSQGDGNAIAGYSLGGLSAFDLAWNHPAVFAKVGVFSGSFWWRSKAYEDGYVDNDRIMHSHIRAGKHKPGMKFWLQAGTHDETDDRNGNGIIDAIDDTLDIIAELTHKGYRPQEDIEYYQMEGGQHNPHTWAQAMPVFLEWAFGGNR